MKKRLVTIITALVFLLGTVYVPVNYAVEPVTSEPATEATSETAGPTTEPTTEATSETTKIEFRNVKVPLWFCEADIVVKNPNIETDRTTEPAIFEAAEDVVKSPSGVKSTASYYDARNEAWYNNIIKNQYNTGLCWACTTATAAELSYGCETGSPVVSGLSPAHLGYFFYNRVNDPLGNTGGDRNRLTNPRFKWYMLGGNHIFTYIAMSGWTGMAEDSSKYSMKTLEAGTVYPAADAYNNRLILEESKLIKVVGESDTNDEELIEAARQNVKNAIVEKGAVASSVYLASSGGNYKHLKQVTTESGDKFYTCNNNEITRANHAVTVIGWDDNFSRENFYHSEDGSVDYRPQNDGAWLIQNSWGRTEKQGYPKYEYFWLSYEDKGFALIGYEQSTGEAVRYVATYDMQPVETYDYNYHYDGTAGDGEKKLESGDKVANIYDVTSTNESVGQSLDAIGFITQLDGNSSFKIEIYKNIRNRKDPESGEKVYSTTFETDKVGFYTVPLSKKINLREGDNYSVVITSLGTTYFGIEKSSVRGDFTFDAELAKGQSYYYSTADHKWQDAAQLEWCARIKGFAHVHKPKKTPYKEVTCTEDGHKTYWTCTECGAIFSDEKCTEQIESPKIIKALGHDFERIMDQEPLNGQPGICHEECTRCGKIQNEGTIVTGSVTNADITIIGRHTYTGRRIMPEVEVSVSGSRLQKNRDYKVSFTDNINAGNATVTISGIGDFGGEASKTFRIDPAKITGMELSQGSFTYNGNTLKPAVKAVYAGKEVIKDGHVETNPGGKAVGTYTVNVKGTGNYTGTLSKTFTIRPAGTEITRLYSKKRSFRVRWKAQRMRMNKYRINGYRIKYSRSANMSNAGTRNVKRYKRTSRNIYRCKRGTTYYVQIQTYMKVKGKTYYSDWSKVKTVKTR